MRAVANYILLLIVILMSCHQTPNIKHNLDNGTLVMSISDSKLSLITLNIKGDDFVFVLADKSKVCLIDSATSVKRNLKVERSIKPVEIVTLGGVTIKDYKTEIMNYPFYQQNLSCMIRGIYCSTGVTVDGIIGMDLLSDKNAMINIEREIIQNKLR